MGGTQGQATDIEIYTREMLKTREKLYQITAKHTGKPIEQVTRDSERDFYMTAEEAVAYGIIDKILEKKPEEIKTEKKD
jgi:ATP-dependent Clp protease protease subunit